MDNYTYEKMAAFKALVGNFKSDTPSEDLIKQVELSGTYSTSKNLNFYTL